MSKIACIGLILLIFLVRKTINPISKINIIPKQNIIHTIGKKIGMRIPVVVNVILQIKALKGILKKIPKIIPAIIGILYCIN